MALHQTGAKIGMACMLFLSFCGWVVSIGGTAHATNECRENTDEWKENDTVGESGHLQPFPGDSADEDRAYDCGACAGGAGGRGRGPLSGGAYSGCCILRLGSISQTEGVGCSLPGIPALTLLLLLLPLQVSTSP